MAKAFPINLASTLMAKLLACFVLVTNLLGATIFDAPPIGFESRMEVVGLFLHDNEGRILLLHRIERSSQGNRWGIPGGKLKVGESPVQAAMRECAEETGVSLAAEQISYLEKVYIREADKDFVYHMVEAPYRGSPVAIRLAEKEHKGFTWVVPKEALALDLMEDETPCIKRVYAQRRRFEVHTWPQA
jgi:8-oxo-dGTP pyrophosphatase MutT (NUDIX family)